MWYKVKCIYEDRVVTTISVLFSVLCTFITGCVNLSLRQLSPNEVRSLKCLA
jgi:hypothetical protein